MKYDVATGMVLEADELGRREDPTVLLVCGLGSQMISFHEEFCELLAAEGLHVVRFDNRDVGLSTWLDDQPVRFGAAVDARREGRPVEAPYTLEDMAADGLGLIDALGLERVHVVGVSMGGMIAQVMAAAAPGKVASLTSVMSTTGEADVGNPSRDAQRKLLEPASHDRAVYIEQQVASSIVLGSPGLVDEGAEREKAAAAFDRGFHPAGTARHLLAVWASGDRHEAVASIRVPTLVVHGEVDPLVDVSGGRRTAELIPGARLEIVPGMGHDRPKALWPRLVELIAGHVRAVEAAGD